MKHKKLTLSLVIPVFNEEGYIEACLGSVAAQTVMPDEVMVVDNASTDRTSELAKQYPFITIIKEKRQGVLFARTTGFDRSSSDIIGRIDADTILPPRWVEQVKESFRDKNISAVTGPVGYYDMPFSSFNHVPDHLMRRSIYNWSPKSPFLFGSNMAIRSKAWQAVKAGLCDRQDIHEDLDLAVHLYMSDMQIRYKKNLLAGASGRRYNDKFNRFYGYMSMYRQTYLSHGLHSLAGYAAVSVYWAGYLVVHPIRMAWFKLAPTVKPVSSFTYQSRKNPMQS